VVAETVDDLPTRLRAALAAAGILPDGEHPAPESSERAGIERARIEPVGNLPATSDTEGVGDVGPATEGGAGTAPVSEGGSRAGSATAGGAGMSLVSQGGDRPGGEERASSDLVGPAAASAWAQVLGVVAEELVAAARDSRRWPESARARVVKQLDHASRAVTAAKAPLLVAQEDSGLWRRPGGRSFEGHRAAEGGRKSTRLSSSHVRISYAVFCL